MVEIDRLDARNYIVKNPSFKHDGLVIHGYGGNKEEMLSLAVNLAERSKLRLSVFDLPGHGDFSAEEFSLDNALAALAQAMTVLDRPRFFIGHSLGARLGLMTSLPIAAVISMPGEIVFAGGRAELLRVLRARRVREAAPFSGLKEILAVDVEPAQKTLLLRAAIELKSVTALADDWQTLGVDCRKVDNADHLDIVSSAKTHRIIGEWLDRWLD